MRQSLRVSFVRQTVVIAVVLLLGSLVANKAIERAQATAVVSGPSCTQQASAMRRQSLAAGFSTAGSLSQAENTLARCLIDR